MSHVLPLRWTPLRSHQVQRAYYHSSHRFNVVPAGRRSGKTEIAKRRLVRAAVVGHPRWGVRLFAAAPTRDQAKRIFWEDLKALVPPSLLAREPSETDLTLRLRNGALLQVVGLDRPARIEGQPWDGGVLDEMADVRSEAFPAHVRPALSDRAGWCDLIGVPEGRNHYYDLFRQAQAQMRTEGKDSLWAAFTWPSADILPEAEIAAARRDLDARTFAREYEAAFTDFAGRAYHAFEAARNHAAVPVAVEAPLWLAFDFNVAPGVAVVATPWPAVPDGLAVVDEVHIAEGSTTWRVCDALLARWANHAGPVTCFGDAAGGAAGSAKIGGSDWDLVRQKLAPVFGNRLSFRVPKANPPERVRVNLMNAALCASDGSVRLVVDTVRCVHLVRDLEGVRLGDGGKIDKARDPALTHLSDALGYLVATLTQNTAGAMQRTKLGGI